MVLGPVSTAALLRLFPTVYAGRHVNHRAVSVRRVRTLTLETPGRDLVVYADGERIGPTPIHCEVVPEAVHLLA
jgi:diacylglycerol kinase (ATP)